MNTLRCGRLDRHEPHDWSRPPGWSRPRRTYHCEGTPAAVEGGASAELKTPEQWCAELGARIADPDGWRGTDGRRWTDPISREEFDRRLRVCTVDMRGYPAFYGQQDRP